MQKLAGDLVGLLASTADVANYSDAVINVEGISVPVHKCVLAARCSFFRNIFATETSASLSQNSEKTSLPKQEFDINKLVTSGRIGYKSLMIVLRYFYGGELKGVNEACLVSCMDSSCSHICCRPVIDAHLELLCAASVFDIWELKAVAQRYLLDVIEKAQIEDVLQIVIAAHRHGATGLQNSCMQALALSNMEVVDLEKRLPKGIFHQITGFRSRLSLLDTIYGGSLQDRQCRRIYKALDSDDIELVQLLLTESRMTIDSTYALHYAAAYCDTKTMAELMDLEVADINRRNRRGYTVLHVATIRRDPEMINYVLEKGANLLDITPDGFTALQIAKRSTKNSESDGRSETSDDATRSKICVETLEGATKESPLSVQLPGERQQFMRHLHLENQG